MKLQPLVYATLFAAITGVSLGVQAAPDTENAATTGNAAATESQAVKPEAKKMKPHSHMQEKTGVAPTTQKEAMPDENTKAKKKSQHIHYRDGK